MMRRRTERLTDDLYSRLSGEHAEALSRLAIPVCTVDADGWPHPAMLSYFEVAAIDHDNLQLAIYNDSRTCENLRVRGTATLLIVDEALVCYIRGRTAQVAPAMRTAPYNAVLNLRVDQVVFDEPPPDLEPGAFVTSGITYRPRTGPALKRARAVLAELRGVRTA
jgi:Pyridoxamine 5'-phosphate oxidase